MTYIAWIVHFTYIGVIIELMSYINLTHENSYGGFLSGHYAHLNRGKKIVRKLILVSRFDFCG